MAYPPFANLDMSDLSQWLLLFRYHLRMARVRANCAVRRSWLMTATIVLFLVVYAVAAYFLFCQGLAYVARLPAAGSLLSDRLIYVIFFAFLLMLVFSVAVTGYISLYRSRETSWLLTLPISHRVVFLWKCFESAVFSCWGLIFILTPLLLAFARMRDVLPSFYLRALFALVPFLVIASVLGGLLLVGAVRWLNRRQIIVIAVLVGSFACAGAIRAGIQDKVAVETSGLSAALTFQRVLHHTQMTVSPWSPSTWVAGSLIEWSRPYESFGGLLYPALLLSHCLAGFVLLDFFGRRWFYRSWNKSIQQTAHHALRRTLHKPTTREIERGYPLPSWLRHLTGRPLAAIARKDFLTFFREPAQWVQFTVIFGLLAIYAGGLRQMNGEMEQPRDLYLVAFLNLSVCALALSTLTTRFVFPQFSLEGRRLWVLAMAPVRLEGIVLQKFVSGTLYSGVIVISILILAGFNLRLPFGDMLFFAAAIAALATGLNSLAIGLGVLFPNLEESNAAKIVSGFGGTLCLVSSFIYIIVFILLLAWSRFPIFRNNALNPEWWSHPSSLLPLGLAVLLTLVVTSFPLVFSRNKLKRLEI